MFSRKVNAKNKKRLLRRCLSPDELSRMIQDRAYSYFEKRGGQPGNDLDDWLRAEAEITKELSIK